MAQQPASMKPRSNPSAPARKPLAASIAGAIRADSFKGLVHKLEGEGKSAHYAKAIAGKVNAEKHGDYDKHDAQRDDASETAGGVRISNQTIRRHLGRLSDIVEHPGKDNPKTRHTTSFPETRRESALNHIRNAAYSARDDALTTEDSPMANVSEFRARLDKMRDAIDSMCDALGSGGKGDEPGRDDADEAEEHAAGEELAQGKKDEDDGDKAEGEKDEHEAGEELAKGRDDAESEAERSKAGKVARRHQLETERGDAEPEEERSAASEEGHEHEDEHKAEKADDRGDRSPTEMAEELTEADAMTSSEHAAAARKAWRTRRSDAQTDSDAEIRAKIARLEARLARATRPVSRQERDAMAAAQARCDSVAQMFGLKAEPPLVGEHLDSYRRRLVAPLQKYSKRWEKTSLDRAPDDVFANIEEQIYADAQAAAKLDGAPEAGRLVPVRSVDAAGRTITKFYGDPNAWMAPFKARGLSIRINGVGRRD